MKRNRDSLTDLCANTVKLMDIIKHQILSRQGMPTNKLTEICQEFEKSETSILSLFFISDSKVAFSLMKDVLKAIEQIQARTESAHGKVKEFFKSDTTTEQVNGLEKKIQMFLSYIQVFAIA